MSITDNTNQEEMADLEKLPVQLELNIDLDKEPEKIVRPEHNVGRMAHYIFTNPRSSNLEGTQVHKFPTQYQGQKIDGELIITPGHGHQRPTTTTLRIFYGLIQIWESTYREELSSQDPDELKPSDYRAIAFSGNQLCKQIGWTSCGENFASIRTHLNILRKTTIDWRMLFREPDTKKPRRIVRDMSLVHENNYIEEGDLFGSSKFSQHHEVLLSDIVVEGMIKGHVRPFNFLTYKSIKNPTASALYTHLDYRLSKSDHYSHNARSLLFDVLGLTGEYLRHKSRRRYYLEKMQKELDGKEIGVSTTNPTYLRLSIAETADGSDWKLIASKISEKAILSDNSDRSPRKFVRPLRKKTEAIHLANDLLYQLKSHPKVGKLKTDDLIGICLYTPEDILRMCVRDVLTDYRNSQPVRKSISALFFHAVKEQMDKRSLPYPK